MPLERQDCVRCGEIPAVNDAGYCSHCHWAVRTEVEQGLVALRNYLAAWQRFEDWCAKHEQAA